jgi:hypothetical protein
MEFTFRQPDQFLDFLDLIEYLHCLLDQILVPQLAIIQDSLQFLLFHTIRKFQNNESFKTFLYAHSHSGTAKTMFYMTDPINYTTSLLTRFRSVLNRILDHSEYYRADYTDFQLRMNQFCHSSPLINFCFPSQFNMLFNYTFGNRYQYGFKQGWDILYIKNNIKEPYMPADLQNITIAIYKESKKDHIYQSWYYVYRYEYDELVINPTDLFISEITSPKTPSEPITGKIWVKLVRFHTAHYSLYQFDIKKEIFKYLYETFQTTRIFLTISKLFSFHCPDTVNFPSIFEYIGQSESLTDDSVLLLQYRFTTDMSDPQEGNIIETDQYTIQL